MDSTRIQTLARIMARDLTDLAEGQSTDPDLSVLRLQASRLEELTRLAVRVQRTEGGASWAEIGEALGMSRQAAWERFRGGS